MTHEGGLTVAYDDSYWEIASLTDGFILKEKGVRENPRAAMLTFDSGGASGGQLEQRVESVPGGGGQLHNIRAGKACPQGPILLNASYQSEKAADFRQELKLLQQAECPE
jgi:hypothetical protein